jgi:Flp pilus assembly protein TadD
VGEAFAVVDAYQQRRPAGPVAFYVHFRLGNIHEKRGNKLEARTEYELAVKLDGRNDVARRALAALK